MSLITEEELAKASGLGDPTFGRANVMYLELQKIVMSTPLNELEEHLWHWCRKRAKEDLEAR